MSRSDLFSADLSRADLFGANLTRSQALNTNFDRSILTAACIEDWNINSETQLENAICDYVYLKNTCKDRFPSVESFDPGELSQQLQKIRFNTDIMFLTRIE